MRLTRQTNYAIRILMYCAANPGRLSQVPEIASSYGLSEPFLFKILKPIIRHKFVESVRGRNGGIRLAKPASEITLANVVQITEDSFAMAECFEAEGSDCPLIDHCALNRALAEALSAFFDVLDNYTVEDLVKQRSSIQQLLGIDLLKEVPLTLSQ